MARLLTGLAMLLLFTATAQAQVESGTSYGYGDWANVPPASQCFIDAYDDAYAHYEASRQSLESQGYTVEYWGNDAYIQYSGPLKSRAAVEIYWIYY